MSPEERTAHWREIIEQQRASGLGGAAFCREHSINLSRFYHCRRRLKHNSIGGFLELTSNPPSSRPGLTTAGVLIHMNGDVCIEVAPDFDSTTLQRTVQVLCDFCLDRRPCFP